MNDILKYRLNSAANNSIIIKPLLRSIGYQFSGHTITIMSWISMEIVAAIFLSVRVLLSKNLKIMGQASLSNSRKICKDVNRSKIGDSKSDWSSDRKLQSLNHLKTDNGLNLLSTFREIISLQKFVPKKFNVLLYYIFLVASWGDATHSATTSNLIGFGFKSTCCIILLHFASINRCSSSKNKVCHEIINKSIAQFIYVRHSIYKNERPDIPVMCCSLIYSKTIRIAFLLAKVSFPSCWSFSYNLQVKNI